MLLSQSYSPTPVVHDIKVVANVSDLLIDGKYLIPVHHISKPHVFHIKGVQEVGDIRRAGIWTKGLWSTPVRTDPWSSKPFFLLQRPIDYSQTPLSKMRGPADDVMHKLKRTLKKFQEYEVTAGAAYLELK